MAKSKSAQRVTIKAGPEITGTGKDKRASGWYISQGSVRKVAKTKTQVMKMVRATVRDRLARGISVTLVLFKRDGGCQQASYKIVGGEVVVSATKTSAAVKAEARKHSVSPKPAKKRTRKPAKKKTTASKPASKPKTKPKRKTAVRKAGKRVGGTTYKAFQKKLAAEGKTRKQISAAWKAWKKAHGVEVPVAKRKPAKKKTTAAKKKTTASKPAKKPRKKKTAAAKPAATKKPRKKKAAAATSAASIPRLSEVGGAKPAKKPRKKKTAAAKWLDHVAAFRKAHPEMKMAEVMKKAKSSYKK